MNALRFTVMAVAVLTAGPIVAAPRVHFVDSRVERAGDGSSWSLAVSTLPEALERAQAGDEIWVARGTYRPTRSHDRTRSFTLKPGIRLYGGFRGDETGREQRDWKALPTVLSGDIGREGDRTDNVHHVVVGADGALLDGFTITGGYGLNARESRRRRPPGGRPGQIHTSPEAILSGPDAAEGAGMLNFQCAPTIRNCIFEDNHSGKGGAMYNMASRRFPPGREASPPAPVVIDCVFRDNFSRNRGGAVSNDLGTSPTFRRCTFVRNVCEGKGGAIYNDFSCSPRMTQCLFAENRAFRGGAIGNDGGSSPRIAYCTFTRNEAVDLGAALYQGTGPANNPVVTACIIWGNRCENGPAEIVNWHDNSPRVTRSCVQGGYPGEGNVDRAPGFVDAEKGDFRLRPDSPCRQIGHRATVDGSELARVESRPEPRMIREPGREGRPPPRRRPPEDPPVFRVDGRNVQGPRDGQSWKTAYRELQPAIDAAARSGGEVWVAAGTYRPRTGEGRAASFRLREWVSVYGGFRGGETARGERDWRKNRTILSGDIGRAGDPSDNAYHVVIGSDRSELDGFTIRDGVADGETYDAKGGGMINYRRGDQGPPRGRRTGFSPVVRNCSFVNNRAVEGGAVYNYDRGSPLFENCRFVDNRAENGGALVDRVGVLSDVSRCVFERNVARWRAGAVYLDYGSRPIFTECRFVDNRSDGHGGAVYILSRASQLGNTVFLLEDCVLEGNTATKRGGAIANSDSGFLGLKGCRFRGNRAGEGGGALSNDYRGRAVLLDCTFEENRAARGEADVDSDRTSRVSESRRDWPSPGPPGRSGAR